jgi:hypothetical protein
MRAHHEYAGGASLLCTPDTRRNGAQAGVRKLRDFIVEPDPPFQVEIMNPFAEGQHAESGTVEPPVL